MTSNLAERMKEYELSFSKDKLMSMLPTYVRLDGRAFHTFTKRAECLRPYDEELRNLMKHTTACLIEEFNFEIGYTQSDEISLCTKQQNYKSELIFDGKVYKILSHIAAYATSVFTLKALEIPRFKQAVEKLNPTFDCRVVQFPNEIECCNMFLWREKDAVRNSINSLGQAYFSDKQLFGKNTDQVQDMLMLEKGINWNDCTPWQKRGSWVGKRPTQILLLPEALEKIPFGYQRPENGIVTRNMVQELDMPIFSKVTNKEDVIFRKATPEIENEMD